MAQTIGLGLDARYAFVSGACGHRLDGGAASIAGSIEGVLDTTVPGATGAQDRAELSAGPRMRPGVTTAFRRARPFR